MMQARFGGIDAELSPAPLINCARRADFFSALSDFVAQSEEAEQRILYFTGHGKVLSGNYGFVIGDDFMPFAVVTGLLQVGRARTLFILDTCHSGAADLGGVKTDGIPLETAGSAIFASSRDIQLSREDGKFGSLFTHYLCECITSGNGGTPTTGGLITVPDAIDYIRKKIRDSGHSAQNPIYTVRNSEGPLWIAINVSGSVASRPESLATDEDIDKLGERCSGATLDALDADVLAQYAGEHVGSELKTVESIADALGLYAPGSRSVPSKAAVLCFGSRPSAFFPNAISMFSAGDRTSDSFERSPIDGPLIRQLQNLVQLTSQQLRSEAHFDDDGGRTDVLEIPIVVLREVMSNALAHRDFDRNGQVHVHVDAECVTVSNPGVEPDGRTWPDMLEHPGFSLTSNRRLANLLQAVRGHEGVGRGFNVLHRYRLERGDDAVIFRQLGGTVVCKLRRPPAARRLLSRALEDRVSQFVLERANALSHRRGLFGRSRPAAAVGKSGLENRTRLLEELTTLLKNPGTLVALSGSAGTGKSYVLRELYLVLALNERNKLAHSTSDHYRQTVPIFVSLRELSTDLPFMAAVAAKTAMEPTLLEYIFKLHEPILILDGLDECAPDIRPQLVETIREVKEANPRLSIVISSRQLGPTLIDRSEVSKEIGNLSSDDVRRIIKAEMPADAAKSFLRVVSTMDEQLSSNPLMLRLAMQMYDQFGVLPDSLDGLIAAAFDMLWLRHDATKDSFVRRRRTSIEPEYARHILGRLALFLVVRSLVVAPRSEVTNFLRRSVLDDAHQFRGELSIRPEDLLLDFAETGLLEVDEDGVSFIHRAFLEYFALYSVSHLNPPSKEFGRLILILIKTGISADRVMSAVSRWPSFATEHEALRQALSERASVDPVWRAALEQVREGVVQEAKRRSQDLHNFSDLFGD